jgi:AcrR family transcriptional regulator
MTPKGEATRARIVEAALQLFATQGFASTTLRDIASAAGVSLGLTYRYFRTKEELVLVLYEDVAKQVQANVPRLPHDTIAVRFAALVEHKLRILTPNKGPFAALLVAALDPASKASVLGDASSGVREAMRTAFRALVDGADDAPVEGRDAIAALLYAAHLLLLLSWVHDATPNARRTRDVLRQMRDAIAFARPFLAAPGAVAALDRAMKSLAPVFWKERV